MPYSMAGRVKEVEGAVAKVVVSGETTDGEILGKGDFKEFTVVIVGF